MKLKKCLLCKLYTFKESCPKCKKKTSDAHYKFIKIKKPNSKIYSREDSK